VSRDQGRKGTSGKGGGGKASNPAAARRLALLVFGLAFVALFVIVAVAVGVGHTSVPRGMQPSSTTRLETLARSRFPRLNTRSSWRRRGQGKKRPLNRAIPNTTKPRKRPSTRSSKRSGSRALRTSGASKLANRKSPPKSKKSRKKVSNRKLNSRNSSRNPTTRPPTSTNGC